MRAAAVAAALLACGLSACAANPGPPPVVDEAELASSQSSSTSPAAAGQRDEVQQEPSPQEERTTVSVGVDPLRGGLNPHVVADNSALVSQIAALVLPSPFVDGRINSNVLESAEELPAPEGMAQRVRYTIAAPAQWSDGTPISGADFGYLWQKMISTPGVNSPAGYFAISAVRTSEGGRVVTVDFLEPVAQWRLLFDNLLPSHLLEGEDFATALADGIPASAGRYLVAAVDRGRGVITLNRNDRFWGTDPANIDVIQLRTVRDTTQAANMLRSGQVGFIDITPQQTSEEALGLVEHVVARSVQRPRQLRLHFSARSGALADAEQRRGLASLVDTGQVARLASGRAEPLRPGNNPVTGDVSLLPLRERAGHRPIRLAADPTDAVALAAANVIADVLEAHGIDAEVQAERMSVINAALLPQGKVDAVITWEDISLNSLSMASFFQCEGGDGGQDPSGYCAGDAAQQRQALLSGALTAREGLARVREINAEEVLYVPLLDEVRIHALGRGIVGPGPAVEDWDAGLRTAPSWTIDEY